MKVRYSGNEMSEIENSNSSSGAHSSEANFLFYKSPESTGKSECRKSMSNNEIIISYKVKIILVIQRYSVLNFFSIVSITLPLRTYFILKGHFWHKKKSNFQHSY